MSVPRAPSASGAALPCASRCCSRPSARSSAPSCRSIPSGSTGAGLGAREIAIITAAPLVVRVVVTPALAFAADRFGDHRRFLIGLAWAGAGCCCWCWRSSRSFWPILFGTVLFSLAWTTIMPLTETVAMSGVKAAGLDYGRMRLWGSLSFIVASICGGWVLEPLGAGAAIWLVAGGVVLTVAAAHALQRPIGLGRLKAATSPPRLELADALGLLRSRVFLLFLLATGAGAGRARHVLHLRRPALARAGPGHGLVGDAVGRSPSFARSRCLPTRRRCCGASAPCS